MADPLSIASGVAGVVSFGLEVCRGLMEYYDKWKGYDADVTALHNSIDNLAHILTHFEERLRTPSYMKPDAVKTVLSNIATCTEGLKRLEAKLHKVKPEAGLADWISSTASPDAQSIPSRRARWLSCKRL